MVAMFLFAKLFNQDLSRWCLENHDYNDAQTRGSFAAGSPMSSDSSLYPTFGTVANAVNCE
jgi:hypothetical protein